MLIVSYCFDVMLVQRNHALSICQLCKILYSYAFQIKAHYCYINTITVISSFENDGHMFSELEALFERVWEKTIANLLAKQCETFTDMKM